jgi:hypothetical protein
MVGCSWSKIVAPVHLFAKCRYPSRGGGL